MALPSPNTQGTAGVHDTLDPVEVRCLPCHGATCAMVAPDGNAAAHAAVQDVAARRARGEDAVLVWDLDGTLLDSRPRMLRVVHAFGRHDVQLHEVQHTWQHTAQVLGLNVDAFRACWNDVFWDPDNFLHDLPIQQTVWCARWAQSLGIPNIILTGRVDENLDLTWQQLERLALTPAAVITKPSMELQTPAFKTQQMVALRARGVFIGAFLTDSVEELAAAHHAGLPCILCALDGTAAANVKTPVAVWPTTPTLTTRAPDPLLPLGLPLSPWMLHAVAQELGADLASTSVPGPVTTHAEFVRTCALLGWDQPRATAALERVRQTACEHVLNEGGHRARVRDGTLDPNLARGQHFNLTLVRVASPHAVVLRSTRFPTAHLDELLVQPDGCVLPIHPQQLPHCNQPVIVGTLGARATASGRTVRTELPGCSNVLLKCDLAHVFMDRHPRGLTIADAELALRNSDFLAGCLEDGDSVCILPEVLAVGDQEANSACVVRLSQPFPNGAKGCWTIPAYCLWASTQALGGTQPLIIQWQDRLGPDALFHAVLAPLVSTMVRLMLDFGCAYLGHGQNIHVELGHNGLPTGRVVLTDMEDLWPHPQLCEALHLAYPLDETYRQAHATSSESNLANTFQDYFLWKLMQPLLLCLEDAPHDAHPYRQRVNDLVRTEVMARADTVVAFRAGALRWFFETYLQR